ncbi:DUF4191 domain-containing protein [soil metagenome]
MATEKKAAAKPDRKARRAAKKANKRPRGERIRQIRQAYTISKQYDPKLPWVMLLVAVITFTVIEVAAILFGNPWLFLPLALVAAVLAATIVFGRRAQRAALGQVEGRAGAAAWVLEGIRGDWRVTPTVAGNSQLDAVHRVLGRPGVMLVAEGVPHRVKPLLAQEKKKVARVLGDVPIYDIVVGDEEGQVPLRKLSSHVTKLPRNTTSGQVNKIEKRLQALGGMKIPLPKGPMPKGNSMSVSQRTLRRR